MNLDAESTLFGIGYPLPFFFLLVAAVAIITVFPQIVMLLPKLAFPD